MRSWLAQLPDNIDVVPDYETSLIHESGHYTTALVLNGTIVSIEQPGPKHIVIYASIPWNPIARITLLFAGVAASNTYAGSGRDMFEINEILKTVSRSRRDQVREQAFDAARSIVKGYSPEIRRNIEEIRKVTTPW